MCGTFELKPQPGEPIEVRDIVIGQYADYIDTGIWTFKEGLCVAPDDLTIAQLKDHLLTCGGAVYLHESGRLCWFNRL